MVTAAPSNSSANAVLARKARELFLGTAVQILNETAKEVRTKFSALLEQSGNARESQDRRDAWLAYQKSEPIWIANVITAWKKGLLPPSTSSTRSRSASQSFELLGEDVMEDKILTSRLSLRIIDKASWELNDLTVRIRHLEDSSELARNDVLRPESCAESVVQAWMAAELSREAWVMMQDLILKSYGDKLVQAYHAANEFLISKDVLAEIELRHKVKKVPSAGSGTTSLSPLDSQPASMAPTQTGPLGQTPGGRAGSVGAGQGGYGAGQAGQGGGGYAGGGQGGQSNSGPVGGGQGAGGQGASGYAGGGQGGQGGGGYSGGGQGSQGGSGYAGGAQGGGGHAGGGQGGAQSGGHAGSADAQGMTDRSREMAAQQARATHEETRMMTSATPMARAKMRAQGVMGQLKRMLTDRVVGFDDSRTHAPSPQLAVALGQRASGHVRTQVGAYQDGGAAGGVGGVAGGGMAFAGFSEGMAPEQAAGALRRETAELKKAASTSAEKATIEIVALMFQSILAEDRIPAVVRVWFARLQMPVLRLALAEPEFFGTLQHPARRLIDRMGSCVLGFEANVSSEAMETEIKRVVQVIEQYPETGRRVYQLVYDEFQKFLARFLTEGTATQRVVSVAQQVEQKETAAIQYIIELRKLVDDVPIRDEIRDFFFKVWAEVLAVASVKQGAQHADTINLKQVAADLVWAAGAKPSRADRAKVIQGLPQLLKRLRSGMTLLGLDTAKQDAHIKVISDTLADAFMSKTETVDAKQIEAMAKRLKNLEDYVSEEDEDVGDLPLDAENIELMLGIDTSGIDIITAGGSDPTDAMRAWAKELEEGTWFNLDHNGKVARVQYAWRSKQGQLHLFASTSGRTYLFQVRRLASYLQAGLLAPIEDETLTVRATRAAMTKLEANPERLLATSE